jgi:hypothetical protein
MPNHQPQEPSISSLHILPTARLGSHASLRRSTITACSRRGRGASRSRMCGALIALWMATPSSPCSELQALRRECCCVGNVVSDLRCLNAHVSLRSTMVLWEIKVNLVLASSTIAGIINQSSNQIRRNTTLFSLAQRRSINLYYPSYEVVQ